MLIHHRLRDEIDVRRHAGLRVGVARRGHGVHALQEGQLLLRDRRRIPAQLPDRPIVLVARRGAPKGSAVFCKSAGMLHGGADAIEPRALVGAARRRERRARQLLGIEPVGAALRRVAPDRQRAGQRLGLEAVAEAGHVARRDVDGVAVDQIQASCVDVHRTILLAGLPTFRGRACRSRSRDRRCPTLRRMRARH